MRWHMTNENRSDNDGVKGSAFWAARAWLYLNDKDGFNGSKEIHFEWYFGKHARHTTAEVKTSFVFERELTFSLGIFRLFCFYVTFAFPFFPSWSYEHGDRQLGVRIFDGSIWIDLWRNDDHWRTADPFWKRPIVITPADILLGKRKYSEKDISEHYAEIPMPESNYPAKVKFFESTWKRPRWPFAKRMVRANVDMFTPIPFPGKGENSWDMDDDAIFSSTGPWTTIEAAIDGVKASVMRNRERYGSADWQPSTN